MAQLSAVSGVTIPTIKRYLREGLLPPGRRTGPNQASYDLGHVRRLRQIATMTEIGGLTAGDVATVLAMAEAADRDMRSIRTAIDSRMALWAGRVDAESGARGRELLEELCTERGWNIDTDALPARVLARLLALATQINDGRMLAHIGDRAIVMEQVAALDLELLADSEAPICEFLDSALFSTLLGDAILITLRRLAQHHLLNSSDAT